MRVQPPEHWDRLDPYVLFEWVRQTRDPQLLDELLEVRRLVEGEAVALAAMRRAEDDLSSLSTLLEGMQRTLHDPDTYSRLDSKFHDRLLRAAKNRMLAELIRPVRPLLDAGRMITSRQIGLLLESQQGHEAIYRAVYTRDARKARDAMQRHIAQFEQDIKRALLDRGSTLDWEHLCLARWDSRLGPSI
jgi:DNA-binding FadR family transcriptional regulator